MGDQESKDDQGKARGLKALAEQMNNEATFFEELGIDWKSLKGKYVEVYTGKRVIKGVIKNFNSRFGIIQMLDTAGLTTFVKISKISNLSYRE